MLFEAVPHPRCYLTFIVDKTHHGPVAAPFSMQLLQLFSYVLGVLVTPTFFHCRNCSALKTEKEYLCCQEVEAVPNFNHQGLFALSQEIILSELQKQSPGGVL